MQLYCPACENVVHVEDPNPVEVVPCPECNHPIRGLGLRKARPVAERHIVAAPPRLPPSAPPASPPPAAEPDASDEVAPDFEVTWEEEPVEQDFTLPCPEEGARYVPLPYRPEGGVSVARVPLFLLAVVLAGAALGALASTFGQVCYLVLVYPLAIGLGVAGLTVLAGHVAQVRSPLAAGMTALLGGMAALLVMHHLDYRRTLSVLATESFRLPPDMAYRLTVSPGLLEYLDATAREGLTISGRDQGGLNLGYGGTYLYWGIEFLLVGVLSAVGGSSGARDAFCPYCRRWKEDRFLGTTSDGGQELQRELRRGNLSGLEHFTPALASGELAFTASVCPRCGPGAPIDLRVERNPRARLDPVSPELPVHLTYPGEALPVLEEVFAARN